MGSANLGLARRSGERRIKLPEYSGFPRAELVPELQSGEAKIRTLLAGRSLHYAAGATLIPAGEDHLFVYRAVSGWAGRARDLPDGRRQFILLFLPGDLFAVKSMFISRHPDDVVALSDLRVERVDYRTLLAAYKAEPDIAARCSWQVVEEERRLHNWVVSLGQGSAEERIALLLLELRSRLILSGNLAEGAASFAMPLTQAQLGDYLGITSVHVSRVLSSLAQKGLATINRGVVQVENLDALENVAAALADPLDVAAVTTLPPSA